MMSEDKSELNGGISHPKFLLPEDSIGAYQNWKLIYDAFGFSFPPKGFEKYCGRMEELLPINTSWKENNLVH